MGEHGCELKEPEFKLSGYFDKRKRHLLQFSWEFVICVRVHHVKMTDKWG